MIELYEALVESFAAPVIVNNLAHNQELLLKKYSAPYLANHIKENLSNARMDLSGFFVEIGHIEDGVETVRFDKISPYSNLNELPSSFKKIYFRDLEYFVRKAFELTVDKKSKLNNNDYKKLLAIYLLQYTLTCLYESSDV